MCLPDGVVVALHCRDCRAEPGTFAGWNAVTGRIVPWDDGAGDVGMSRCRGMPSRESFGPGEQNHQQSNECPGSGYDTPASRLPIADGRLGFGINAIQHGITHFLHCTKWVAPSMLTDRGSHGLHHNTVSQAKFLICARPGELTVAGYPAAG